MTVCPIVSDSFGATMRHKVSMPPPGACEAIMRIVFDGYAACCAAASGTSSDASIAVTTMRRATRITARSPADMKERQDITILPVGFSRFLQ
jgi:hypothetical protein